MSGRTNSRFERSSFKGLSIIEGERIEDAANNSSNDSQLCKQRNERRRRTSSLAQNNQIRDLIADAVKELDNNSNGLQQKTAEDRIKKLLAEVKEGGFSSARIFSALFPNTSAGDGKPLESVPKQAFIQGLEKLGFRSNKDEDLDSLCSRFDLNDDGMISLDEFQSYCYTQINSVAWKAERQRLEKATADAATSNETSSSDENTFDLKDIKYAAGDKVHETSKLFWKSNLRENISLRYCSDLDVLSIVLQDAESHAYYKTLYVKKSDCTIDQEALEEASTLAVQASDETSDEAKDAIRNNIHWDFYSNYLVARLQMNKEGDSYTPELVKLHGDSKSLETEKPHNLIAPQQRCERKSGSDVKSLQDEFENKVRSFQRDSRSARTSRKSAHELSSIIESAMSEILLEDAEG